MQLQEAHSRQFSPNRERDTTPRESGQTTSPFLISKYSSDRHKPPSFKVPSRATTYEVPEHLLERRSPSQRPLHTGIQHLVRTAACVFLVSPAYFTPHMTNELSCHQCSDISLHTYSKPSSSCSKPSSTGRSSGFLIFFRPASSSSATRFCTCNHHTVPEALHIVVLCLAVVCRSPPCPFTTVDLRFEPRYSICSSTAVAMLTVMSSYKTVVY